MKGEYDQPECLNESWYCSVPEVFYVLHEEPLIEAAAGAAGSWQSWRSNSLA